MMAGIEDVWRERFDNISKQLAELAVAQRATSDAVQAMRSEFVPRATIETMMSARVSNEAFTDLRREVNERFNRLEQQPAGLRSVFGTYGGCIGQLVFAVFSMLAILLSLAGVLAVHWK